MSDLKDCENLIGSKKIWKIIYYLQENVSKCKLDKIRCQKTTRPWLAPLIPWPIEKTFTFLFIIPSNSPLKP